MQTHYEVSCNCDEFWCKSEDDCIKKKCKCCDCKLQAWQNPPIITTHKPNLKEIEDNTNYH